MLSCYGDVQVCVVDVEGVARGLGLEGQTVVGISHAIDMDFSLSFKSGVKVRCSLPALPHLQHPISEDFALSLELLVIPPPLPSPVELCVGALKQVLSYELALELLCCYAQGCWTSLLSQEHALQHFLQWMGTCLGSAYPHGDTIDNTMESHTLQQLPALKLLSLGNLSSPPASCSVAMDTAPPVPMNTVCLDSYKRTVVLSLHLVYEVREINM